MEVIYQAQLVERLRVVETTAKLYELLGTEVQSFVNMPTTTSTEQDEVLRHRAAELRSRLMVARTAEAVINGGDNGEIRKL